MIARVLPLTRTRAVRGAFDYRLRADQGEVAVGSLLRVPFGRQAAVGVVVELAASSELPESRLAEPTAVLPVRLPVDLVALALWMADEYCSTPARALSILLPPGSGTHPPGARERQVLVASLTEAGTTALADGAGVRLTAGQRAALELLAGGGERPAAEVGTAVLRRLEARGLASVRRVKRRPPAWRPARHRVGSAAVHAPLLNDEQRAALAPVLHALRSHALHAADSPGFLLHGVTGSGKTEVYLHAVQAALEAGRGAIILVPEIALTPQALARFEARFGDVVAMLHSGLGQGARHKEWLRLARGEARVCVGPRSAVFAPLDRIGVIVVDEEHESAYKHEGDPRYDARAVAERRAREHGAVLLAGSATPRPESVQRLVPLRLARRVDGRPLPKVEIVDMRGLHHPLHPRTRLALADVRRSGGKAIVLLNRRGWSNFLSCQACGHVWMCPNCEVALVLHRIGPTNPYVSCHHCGHRERVPESCPACGSVSVSRHGAGTERLEHELVRAFADASFPVLRLDADATGLDARARTLEAFAGAGAGILVGTQMIAKGHDFPDIALGVVIDADRTLRFPDFRAEERTFALVTQLAGRAGRGGDHGTPARVLVQTLAPDARALAFAARHDADGFLAGELRRRELLSYPPFATLIRIVCSAVEAGAAVAAAAELRDRIGSGAWFAALGPAPLFALRGRARAQLVIKALDRPATIAVVGAAVDALGPGMARRGVNVSVDVDPQ